MMRALLLLLAAWAIALFIPTHCRAQDVATNRPLPPVTALAITPDGKQLLIGSQAGVEIRTWPALTAQGALATKLRHVYDLVFAPSGKTLAVAGGTPADFGDVELHAWPPNSDLAPTRLATKPNDCVVKICWSDDKTLWFAGADKLARQVDGDGKQLALLTGHSRPLSGVAVLPGKAGLVTVGLDQSVRHWQPNGKLLRTLDNHTAAVNDVALRPADAAGPPWVATCGADRTVRFWQPTIGRLVRFARLPSEPLALAWTTDGSLLLAACADGHLRAIDPADASVVRDFAAFEGLAYALAVHPAGEHVVVGGTRGQVKILELLKADEDVRPPAPGR